MRSGYPANREADVVLHDGSTVHLRPVGREDEAALRKLFGGLSVESRAFRFFSGAVDVERAAATLADVDYADHYGLIAVRGGDRVVGHGLYVRGPDRRRRDDPLPAHLPPTPTGALAADARIRIAPAPPERPWPPT